jgi:quercetin dioxygenase-like cupin family protein
MPDTTTNPASERKNMADNAPRVLLRGEESDGHLAIVLLTGRGRPRLHRHDFDETFYVLEGELTFQLGEKLVTRRAGELAFAPRGTPHTYANLSEAPARALMVITPAGFERYFARIAAERQGVEPPDWARRPIPEVTILGPPIDAETLRGEPR